MRNAELTAGSCCNKKTVGVEWRLFLMLSIFLLGCGKDDGSDPVPASVAVTADAGSDQTVMEMTEVTLRGSGSGDGSLDFSWEQTAGEPTVTLNNADQAVASFETPDVAADSSQTLSFRLRVTDNRGRAATDSVSVTVQESTSDSSLSGNLQFEFVPSHPNCRGLDYANTVLRPIRGATVQLIDAGDDTLIDSTVSSESGSYSFNLAVKREVFVRVRAELKQSGEPSWHVQVKDNTSNTAAPLKERPLYVVDSPTFELQPGEQVRNFVAETGWDGASYADPRAAAPFAILDTAYEAMSLVLQAEPLAQFAPLTMFWSVDNNTTGNANQNIDSGNIGTSFYSPARDSLFLLGMANDDTEEFDSHVIAHEWGHYFEDNFSRSDSRGGPHGLGQRLDMRLAFGEGWATALSGMVTGSPQYCDTFGVGQGKGSGIDMENDRVGPSGWFNEISVLSIIYDLWDEQPDGADLNSLGFAPLFEVFANEQADTPALTSVFSFMEALKSRNPEQATFIDGLLVEHGINGPGVNAYGTNENNDAGAPDVLPLYTDLIPDGTPVTLCSNNQFDSGREGNKLSEYRYLRMQIANPGAYTFSITTQSPESSPPEGFDCADPSNADDPNISQHSDPDFFLWHKGQPLVSGQSCTANREVATSDELPTGDYVMTLREFRYADSATPEDFPEQSCFEIAVTPAS